MIYCILGMSGAGKDTVVNALVDRNKNLKKIIPTTTRPPREGEKDGVDYYFRSREDMAKHKDDYVALESYMVWNGQTWWYGIHKDELKEGNIIATNLKTFRELTDFYGDKEWVVGIYLETYLDVLKYRLEKRGTPKEEIIRRLKKDIEDYYDVENDCMILHSGDLAENIRKIELITTNGKNLTC